MKSVRERRYSLLVSKFYIQNQTYIELSSRTRKEAISAELEKTDLMKYTLFSLETSRTSSDVIGSSEIVVQC